MATYQGLTIGEVADRTGLATSAIRFYEAEGLVHPVRNSGGQRRFDRGDIRRLSFVQIAQGLGFSMREIRAWLERLPDSRTPTKADWTRISRQIAKDLDTRMAQMALMRERLDSCIGCGCLSLKSCALYNPRDNARRNGAGPRYLLGDRPE